MSSIPHLTQSDVIEWTSDVYFKRGQAYYESGAIYEQRREAMRIRSKCSGTQASFYRQEVLYNNKSIESAECSCPVGEGGHCKHIVALLLTWVNDPDSFQESESIDVLLDKYTKGELITLVKQMIEQEPDLESLLELPIIGNESKPLNIKAIRKQVQSAFSDIEYEWGYVREIKRDLNPILKLGASYLFHNDAENSALIYMTIIETIMDNEDVSLGDEEGELLGVSYDCAEALGKCLDKTTDLKKRTEILQVLFNVYKWDTIKIGGAGASDCVPEILIEKTTLEERIEIAKWVRKILPQGSSWHDSYHRQELGSLLLNLEIDILDDEAYLKVCRETGNLNGLIERLLKLGRIQEVENAARAAEDYPLFLSLDIFANYNQTQLAEKIVNERLNKIEDSRLIEWLANRFKEQGNLAGSLELEELLFWKHLNFEKYKTLRELAQKLNRWDNLRTRIIAELEKKQNVEFLVSFYLEEKEVGNALATLKRLPNHWRGNLLHLEVAQAAKKEYPQEAIQIFTNEAQRFINYRNREDYAQAAFCLQEIQGIYTELNEIETWQQLILNIREQYKKLPALQDELNKHKL